MKKKGIMIVLFTALFFLTACGSNGDNISEDGRIVLTLGTVSDSQDLKKQVEAYNQNHPEYVIEIKAYGDLAVEGTDAMNMIQMEIAAGEGPDIIDFGYLYSPMIVGSGIVEDLSAYMDADEDFHE